MNGMQIKNAVLAALAEPQPEDAVRLKAQITYTAMKTDTLLEV